MRILETSGRWRPATFAVVAVAAMGVASGCGDDDAGSSNGGGDSGAAALGTKNPAKGKALTLGYVNDGKGQATDQTQGIAAAKAAAKFVNEYEGGIGGRPIALDVCETKQTPQGAAACATKMQKAAYPIVFYESGGQVGAVAKKVAGAGQVFVTDGGIQQESFTTPGSFNLTNAVNSVYAGPAQLAKQDGTKKAAYIILDVPATIGPTNTLGKGYFAAAGASVDVVRVAPGTPDITPQVQAEIEKGVEHFSIVAESTVCTSAFKALQQLGFKGRITAIAQCFDGTPGEGLPNGAEGITIVAGGPAFAPPAGDPIEPDYKQFKAIMGEYAAGAPLGGTAPNGYRVIRGIAAALEDLKGDVTAASVKAALAAMPPTPLPFGGGVDIQCNGKQSPVGLGFCSKDVVSAELDKDGSVKQYEKVAISLELPAAK